MSKYPPLVEGIPLFHQGKTRDTYATTDPDKLLIVASDRLSTHNVVHESTIPWKGAVLTALTIHWAKFLAEKGISTHLIASGKKIKHYLLQEGSYPDDISARGIIVEKLTMIPVEFIWRAYLAGSLYDKFYKAGKENPYGVELPQGLPLMHPFHQPIFTPTDKSEDDDPLNADEVQGQHAAAVFESYRCFDLIRQSLNKSGIEMVDSKFELGRTGRIVVADEFGTPDSSRFAYLSDIEEGKPPPWLDKQFFRDEAERMWNGGPKIPLTFSSGVIKKGSNIYQNVLAAVIGVPLPAFDLSYHR